MTEMCRYISEAVPDRLLLRPVGISPGTAVRAISQGVWFIRRLYSILDSYRGLRQTA